MDKYQRAAEVLADELFYYDIPSDTITKAARSVVDATWMGRAKGEHEQLSEILRLAREGLSYSQISEQLGVSRSYCGKMAKEHGIDRGGQYSVVEWTDEQRASLRGMFNADLSAAVIAKRFGVTHAAVLKELRRLGLTRRARQSVIRVDGKRGGGGSKV